jgi:hypothetical protein
MLSKLIKEDFFIGKKTLNPLPPPSTPEIHFSK